MTATTAHAHNVSNSNVSAIMEEAAYHCLDRLRYLDSMDRTLAMHGDEVETLFPEVENLEKTGASLVTLNYALNEGGLSPRDFGRAVAAGLDLATFSDAVLLGFKASELPGLMSRKNIPEINDDLQLFVDSRDGFEEEEFLIDEL